MTKSNGTFFNHMMPVFGLALSMLVVLMPCAPFVHADEGTAADSESAVSAVSSDVPETADSASSDSGGSRVGNAWSNTKKFFTNGLSLGDGTGFTPRVRPHLHGDSRWTSNANLGRTNSAAWQARLTPGVTVDLPFGEKLYGQVGYDYTYSTTQGQRISKHANSHTIDALLRYDATDKTAAGVRNSTRWNEMPGQPGNSFFLQTVSPEVTHQFGEHLSTGLRYLYEHYSDITERSSGSATDFFRSAVSNDSFTTNGIAATSSYQIGPNLGLGPNFSWSTRDFAKTPTKDYWQIQPSLAGSYRLGPKTTLGAHFGWAYRKFDVGDGYENELIYGAKATHLLGKKVNWGIEYSKSMVDTFDTTFVFKPVNPEASNLDNYDRHYRVLKRHRLSTTMGYNINEKNSVGANFDFQTTSADANDNIASNDRSSEQAIQTGFTYAYRLTRYISLQLGYAFGRSFTARDNPGRSQYTFHNIISGVNVAF